MSKIRKPTAIVPLPSTYVRSVLGKLGLGGDYSTPYWMHGVLAYAMGFVPSAFLIDYTLSTFAPQNPKLCLLTRFSF